MTQARNDPRLLIDYEKTTRQVYINYCKYEISTSYSLNVICYRGAPPQNSWELPRWTPACCEKERWSTSVLYSHLQQVDAAKGLVPECRFIEYPIDVNRKVWVVRGFCIGKIGKVGPIASASNRIIADFHLWQ